MSKLEKHMEIVDICCVSQLENIIIIIIHEFTSIRRLLWKLNHRPVNRFIAFCEFVK